MFETVGRDKKQDKSRAAGSMFLSLFVNGSFIGALIWAGASVAHEVIDDLPVEVTFFDSAPPPPPPPPPPAGGGEKKEKEEKEEKEETPEEVEPDPVEIPEEVPEPEEKPEEMGVEGGVEGGVVGGVVGGVAGPFPAGVRFHWPRLSLENRSPQVPASTPFDCRWKRARP